MTLHDHERIQERLKSVADPVGFLINLFTYAPVGFAVWTADGKPLLTNFWYDPREHTSITVTEGRRVAISMTIFPLFKASGEIDYVAATYKDETEIMLANERLRVSLAGDPGAWRPALRRVDGRRWDNLLGRAAARVSQRVRLLSRPHRPSREAG